MCGIAAIIRKKPIAAEEITSLIRKISHRGPDATCSIVSSNGQVALGHSRLAIQDTSSAANQPMVTPNGNLSIIYNGEVYNFLEIRSSLACKGHKFLTGSDTEVILKAYSEYGPQCLELFNGMWAIVIHNKSTNEVFIARDRFGVKPLYYNQDHHQVTICSEVDALGRHLRNNCYVNDHYIQRLLNGDTTVYGGNETQFKDTYSLPPGSYAIFKPGESITPVRWYKLERKEIPSSYSAQVDEFKKILWDAVRIRLRSDVPIATCLSGGIDSSSIVCILNNLERNGQSLESFSHRSFTASFPGTPLDETFYTKIIAEQKNITLNTYTVECPIPDDLEDSIRYCDGPMPALSFFPIWRLYKHIKASGISVTLDGQGADEMLGGYYIGTDALVSAWQTKNLFRYIDLLRTYRELHPHARNWIENDKNWLRLYAYSDVKTKLKRPIARTLKILGLDVFSTSRHPLPAQLPESVNESDRDNGNWLAHRLWYQFFSNPLPFLLHQYDRCSMSNGVECRMPFMDYRLVEYTFSLPLQSRIGNGYTKRILRDSMRGDLPDQIRKNRRKIGFNAPFTQWILGPLKSWVNDIVNSQSFKQNNYFNGNQLKSIYLSNNTTNASPDLERILWPAIHFHLWQKKLFDKT